MQSRTIAKRHRGARILLALAMTATALTSPAATLDDAQSLYLQGDYAAVVEMLKPVVRRSPRDANANYLLGASLAAMGDFGQARPYLVKAGDRGKTDAYRLLAENALSRYQPDEASDYVDSWRAKLSRLRSANTDDADRMASRVVMMRNMLARVERIEVLDSLVVPKDDFFRAYRLSGPAGRILPPEAVRRIGAGDDATDLGPAYMPENKTEMLWSQADSTGTMELWGAGILDDGTIDHPKPLDPGLGEGGWASFPFLMPDGMTLYFANTGENSLGGYDIFMTRRTHDDESGDSYMQPQNLGLPYNSAADDYMLAIDENAGLGWWATDRNLIPDSLTIYVFAPSEMRVNVEPDDSCLVALASLSDISLTRRAGVDYRALLAERLPRGNAANQGNVPLFALDIGGRLYTSLSDFSGNGARSAMTEYLGARVALERHLEAENALRQRYGAGETSLGQQILDSEAETARMRERLRSLLGSVVRLESRK